MSVSENIKAKREEAGLTQSELADRVGVTKGFMSQIERGSKIPSLILGAMIAEVCGCSVLDLLKDAV